MLCSWYISKLKRLTVPHQLLPKVITQDRASVGKVYTRRDRLHPIDIGPGSVCQPPVLDEANFLHDPRADRIRLASSPMRRTKLDRHFHLLHQAVGDAEEVDIVLSNLMIPAGAFQHAQSGEDQKDVCRLAPAGIWNFINCQFGNLREHVEESLDVL